MYRTTPSDLYLRGHLPERPGLAIVGTRRACTAALDFARALTGDLCDAGFAIWSGGARGVDGAAHAAALAAGAPTVVALAGGLDVPSPAAHHDLFARVLQRGGALLSLCPDGTPNLPARFLSRNRILGACTLATVVVQAPLVSGARSAAKYARRCDRPVLVAPGAPWDELGAGCAAELRLGATPITCAADVIAAVGGPPGQASTQLALPLADAAASLANLDPAEAELFALLDDRPRHLDALVQRSGRAFNQVSCALLTLCLEGLAVESPPCHYARAGRRGLAGVG